MKKSKKQILNVLANELSQLFNQAKNCDLAGMVNTCYSINGIYSSIPLQEATMEIMACVWQVSRIDISIERLQECIKKALFAIAINDEQKTIAANFRFSATPAC